MENEVKELHRQSNILSTSMNALRAFTWYCDLRDGILRFGEGHEKLGIVASEVDSLYKFCSKIHPKQRTKYIDLITDFCKQDSGEFAIEYELDLSGSGRYEWWEARGSIEMVSDGDLSYKCIYGMDINIDTQKQAQLDIYNHKEELNILNRNNELILNNINSGLAFLNNDYVVEWENINTFFRDIPSMENYRKGECCFSTTKQLSEPCPDCIVVRSIKSRKTETKEIVHPEGNILEYKAIPVFDKKTDARIGSILKIVDITEQKRVRQELTMAKIEAERTTQVLENILDCLPCLLFVKDADDEHKYILVNNFFCHMTGLKESEIIGKTDYEISGSRVFSDRCLHDDKMVLADKELHTYEEDTWFQGKHITWRTTKLAITTVDGRRIILAVSLDITDRIEAYKELHKAKDKAEESNRLKSAFLANMSHEIRTPLNSIVGFSELMMDTSSEEEKKEYFNIIKTNNELLLQLVGDILDLSKIEAGMIEFDHERFDLAGLFDDLYMIFNLRLSNSNVRLVVDNPYETCEVHLDKNRISQVITNFLTNAIKFTPKGQITMGCRYQDGLLTISVSDTGIGIAPDKLNAVFERFEKLNNFAQGTGLGMAICKAIVAALDGEITVESELGKGSTFTVALPVEAMISSKKVKDEHHLTPPMVAPNGKDVSRDQICSKNILVAEDNDSNYLLVQHILKGHKLTRAHNGVEAVDVAKRERFDLILMDVKMPLLDGLGATKEIRKFDTKTPIIAATANAFSTDMDEAMAAGCSDFITKPIIKDTLLRLINAD